MKAFHGKKLVKAKYLARVRAHRLADEIIQGQYWQNGKGCAVGCTIHSSEHTAYEEELGIPTWLARLEDRIFEGLSLEDAKQWPEDFLSAIPVGVDLEQVKGPFLIYVLKSALKTFDHEKFPRVKEVVDKVIKLWTSGTATPEDFKKAREEAHTAAHATYAAYAAYAADVAYAVAVAAAAAYGDGGQAARQGMYKKFAKKLLQLLKGAE